MTALNELAQRLKAAGTISAEDTLALRRQVWPDGKVEADEAELLFALNDAATVPSREWIDFFVEALTEHVVRQQTPRGYIDEAKAAWLVERIAHDGKVESLGELELLIKLLETATNAPASLKQFALAEIERVVVSGEGPTRDGGSLDAGAISAAEVKLLRRLLFAQAGDGPAAISRAEAELLFRIKDATLGGANAPDWQRLFVQCVGNYLMAYSSYRPLERDEASRLESFMDAPTAGVGGFLGRMAQAMGSGAGFREIRVRDNRPDHVAAAEAARAVVPEEAAWLRERIDADGAMDPLEQALMKFVEEESRAG